MGGALRLREQELLKRHEGAWRAELPHIEGMQWGEFRRGFVAAAKFTSFAALRAGAAKCWAAAPVEAVESPWPRASEKVARMAPIPGLREVSLMRPVVDRREVARLAAAPLLSTLRALNARNCGLGGTGFRRLLASPHLGNLTALRVPGNSIGNRGVSALLGAASLTSLEELDLSERGLYGRYGEDPILEGSGLRELAAWPGMARLRTLTLSGNAIGMDGLRALLRSPRATSLKELALRGNGLVSAAGREFADAGPGLRLDVLDLGENLLLDRGAEHLAGAACLSELKVLKLDRCEIALAGSRALGTAPFLKHLRTLNVSDNHFSPDDLLTTLEKESGPLHTLEIVNTIISHEWMARLAKSPASDPLLELDLSQNGLKDHAVWALVSSKHLRNLLILRLNYNGFTAAGRSLLERSALGKRLAVLEAKEMPPEENIPF